MKSSDVAISQFLDRVGSLPKQESELLRSVFDFADKAHEGQMRDSGEPYIIHPVNVAWILLDMDSDTETVAAGLLHDVLEDTERTEEDIRRGFGDTIATLVKGVTNLQHYAYATHHTRMKRQSENFRKFLLSVVDDIRVLIVKMADRLHNMRTLGYLTDDRQNNIARETMDIYAPLANRFGLARMRWELEDLSFKHLMPDVYKQIGLLVNEKKDAREAYIKMVLDPVTKLLEDAGIKAEITGRSKHFYSIYRKSISRNIPFEDIYDLAAIRVIVDTIGQCYEVLGILHRNYEPLEHRFRDYIARPKVNRYQSLHTGLIGPKGRVVEVQIRTREMHAIAEEGVAAHWKYKELQSGNHFDEQIGWIRSMLSQQETSPASEFLEYFKMNLYPEIIIAITPEGDYIKLPKGSTPVDFAFAVHTGIGFRTIGARVNGKFVPLRTELKTGDMVEIITGNTPNPGKDWLEFMKSSKARQKVRTWLRRRELEDAIRLGKEIFDKRSRKAHLKLGDDEFSAILKQMKITDENQLFARLGKGSLLFADFYDAVCAMRKEDDTCDTDLEIGSKEMHEFQGVRIGQIDSLLIHYAKCCNPVPGDQIVGYTTRGRGITVHRKDCPNKGFRKLLIDETERIIPLQWDRPAAGSKTGFTVQLMVLSKNRRNMLKEIVNAFSRMHIELTEARMDHDVEGARGWFSFRIQHREELDQVYRTLRRLPKVLHVERIDGGK